jgi:hypothetical protein
VKTGARLDHRERAGSVRLPSSVQKKISISLNSSKSSSINKHPCSAELKQ